MWLCSLCGLSYNHRQSLNRHMSTNHKEFVSTTPSSSFKCSVCNTPFPKRKEILIHFFEEHGINVEEDSQLFATLQQFKEWKTMYEDQHTLKYVLMFGTDNRRSGTVHYICNRSGTFKSRGNGIRHLKSQSNKKIDGFCPSRMKLHIQENGSCILSFIPTHVGHDSNLAHMVVSKHRGSNLETKIVGDVPVCTGIDSVTNSQHSTKMLQEVNSVCEDLDSSDKSINNPCGAVKQPGDLSNTNGIRKPSRNNCNTESQNVNPEVIPQYLACPIIGEEVVFKGCSLEKNGPIGENLPENMTDDLTVQKMKLIEKFNTIIKSVESHEEASVIEKVLQTIPAALTAIQTSRVRGLYEGVDESANRALQFQRAAKKLKRVASDKDQAHIFLNILTSVNI